MENNTYGSDSAAMQLLVANIRDYAIYMLNPDGKVVSWNAGAERFKGYTAQEILGRHFSQFHTAEDQGAGIPARTRNGQERRQVRMRRLARAQGRQKVLGPCGDRRHPRP